MILFGTLRLVGLAIGAFLHIFLIVLFLRKRGSEPGDRLILGILTAAALWFLSAAMGLFYQTTTTAPDAVSLEVLRLLGAAGGVLAPVLLLHLAAWWAQSPRWLPILAYGTVPVAFWAAIGRFTGGLAWWAGLILLGAGILFARTARRDLNPVKRRFCWAMTGALGLVALGAASGIEAAGTVAAALGPASVLIWFIYRYNFLGPLISRRLTFALRLGVIISAYLFLLRQFALFIEDEFGWFGALLEVALIFVSALLWVPLYARLSRSLVEPSRLYTEAGRRMMGEASRILDLARRVQFLAEQCGRVFGLRRVALVVDRQPPIAGLCGFDDPSAAATALELLRLTAGYHGEMLHAATRERAVGDPLREAGFHYLFPLRYEDKLLGILLIDAAPRQFLDEKESIVLSLSAQIAQSIETALLIEEKFQLEREVVEQEHLASLGKVAASIAHEVKNPLSSIKALAQLMQEDEQVASQYARDLQFIIGETNRLNRSVKQLLGFSRPVPEEKREVDVSAFLETLVRNLEREHAQNGIEVRGDIAPGLILRCTNPETLSQIMLNLTQNSVEAMPGGGRLEISARGRNRHLEMAVVDSGPGIPPAALNRIFEPFYTTKQTGTGLGLAIVRKNVRHLGGEIRVESPVADGRGTRVEVTLPA